MAPPRLVLPRLVLLVLLVPPPSARRRRRADAGHARDLTPRERPDRRRWSERAEATGTALAYPHDRGAQGHGTARAGSRREHGRGERKHGMSGIRDEGSACEALYGEVSGASASFLCLGPALGALDLLAIASRAAARVACEQCDAIESAARILDRVARSGDCVWVAGDAADEHAQRLGAAGQRAVACADVERLPQRLGAGDVLLLTLLGEAPLELLAEARRRKLDAIALVGPGFVAHEAAVVIRVPCYDERALELTHGFIVTALCAETAYARRSESAA
jgi:hypothetical protein